MQPQLFRLPSFRGAAASCASTAASQPEGCIAIVSEQMLCIYTPGKAFYHKHAEQKQQKRSFYDSLSGFVASACAWSPVSRAHWRGCLLAVGTLEGRLLVFGTEREPAADDWQLLLELSADEGAVQRVQWTAAGEGTLLLAAATGKKERSLLAVIYGSQIRQFEVHGSFACFLPSASETVARAAVRIDDWLVELQICLATGQASEACKLLQLGGRPISFVCAWQDDAIFIATNEELHFLVAGQLLAKHSMPCFGSIVAVERQAAAGSLAVYTAEGLIYEMTSSSLKRSPAAELALYHQLLEDAFFEKKKQKFRLIGYHANGQMVVCKTSTAGLTDFAIIGVQPKKGTPKSGTLESTCLESGKALNDAFNLVCIVCGAKYHLSVQLVVCKRCGTKEQPSPLYKSKYCQPADETKPGH